MWIIKWIVGAILTVLVIGFAMQNMEVSVPLKFWKWQTINDLPLWVVLYSSFVAGMLFWLVVSIIQMVGIRSENRKLSKEMKKLKDELNRLRNVSVDETVLATSKKEPTPGKLLES